MNLSCNASQEKKCCNGSTWNLSTQPEWNSVPGKVWAIGNSIIYEFVVLSYQRECSGDNIREWDGAVITAILNLGLAHWPGWLAWLSAPLEARPRGKLKFVKKTSKPLPQELSGFRESRPFVISGCFTVRFRFKKYFLRFLTNTEIQSTKNSKNCSPQNISMASIQRKVSRPKWSLLLYLQRGVFT